jgi:hypothetical protein
MLVITTQRKAAKTLSDQTWTVGKRGQTGSCLAPKMGCRQGRAKGRRETACHEQHCWLSSTDASHAQGQAPSTCKRPPVSEDPMDWSEVPSGDNSENECQPQETFLSSPETWVASKTPSHLCCHNLECQLLVHLKVKKLTTPPLTSSDACNAVAS